MALSRTLVRTFAPNHCVRPELDLETVNRHMLLHTATTWFVTTFYAVIDLKSGLLTYSNAGHNSPVYLSDPDSTDVKTLGRTGLPLGISNDRVWGKRTLQMKPGGLLLLYTDGVTDSRNDAGEFFGSERLVRTRRKTLHLSAQEILSSFMYELPRFMGTTPQGDDMASVLLKPESF